MAASGVLFWFLGFLAVEVGSGFLGGGLLTDGFLVLGTSADLEDSLPAFC